MEQTALLARLRDGLGVQDAGLPRYKRLRGAITELVATGVLKPGARFVVLEFTTPRFAPLRALYLFYFRRVLPAMGRAVSKHRDAYTYLPESVLEFPDPDALAARLKAAGFSDVHYQLLTGGICAVHHGTR